MNHKRKKTNKIEGKQKRMLNENENKYKWEEVSDDLAVEIEKNMKSGIISGLLFYLIALIASLPFCILCFYDCVIMPIKSNNKISFISITFGIIIPLIIIAVIGSILILKIRSYFQAGKHNFIKIETSFIRFSIIKSTIYIEFYIMTDKRLEQTKRTYYGSVIDGGALKENDRVILFSTKCDGDIFLVKRINKKS